MKHNNQTNRKPKKSLCMTGLAAGFTGLFVAVMRMEAYNVTPGVLIAAILSLALMALCAYPLRYQPEISATELHPVPNNHRPDHSGRAA